MPLQPIRDALVGWKPSERDRADRLTTIRLAWASIVGVAVAAQSMPIAATGTTLLIATRSSAWSQQLQFLSMEILERLKRLELDEPVERLTFRTGALRAKRETAARPARPRVRPAAQPQLEVANDSADAFEHVRRRLGALRAATDVSCAACGAPLDGGPRGRRCAPCAAQAERARTIALERLLYMTPWLDLATLREHLPGLDSKEYERVRRGLLQRWWLVLERARRAGKAGPSHRERDIASSYILLQSRLPPDRLTPEVVRNIVGPEVEAFLWPHADKATGTNSAK